MPFPDAKTLERRLRIITTVLGAVFLAEGLTKWLGLSLQVELFRRLGLPGFAMQLVGTLEIGFAVLVLNRGTRPWGAMGLGLVMVGATLTHVMTGVLLPMIFASGFLFTLCVWVVMKDRPVFLRLA